MAKVTFKPEPGTPDTHTQFGITWGPDPVEIDNPVLLAKLKGNPFYEVDDSDDGDAAGHTAVHNGGGRFIVVLDGNKAEPVLKGLAKADADAFNALSDEDKAAYIEAHKAE